jgi:hypothetical protein
MGLADFTNSRLLPALRRSGLSPDDISASRKVQEVVYLLERFGVGLGFRYKWEVFGPFSSELADEVGFLDRTTVDDLVLDVDAEDAAFARISRLMAPPEHLDLSEEDWLRLLVCVDFVETRVPGITENGTAPPFISLNFAREAIDAARQEVEQGLTLAR